MNKCLGCGSLLQYDNPNLEGYTSNKDATYCERCFRTMHYNELKSSDLKYNNTDLLNQINEKSSLTLFLVDRSSGHGAICIHTRLSGRAA